MLLDNGAVIDKPGGMDNDTSLHNAIYNDHLECVQLLVSRGADKTIRYVAINSCFVM